MAPWTSAWICRPRLPPPPLPKRDAQHKLTIRTFPEKWEIPVWETSRFTFSQHKSLIRHNFRRMSETPTTATSQKSISIHFQFVLQYASNLYCSGFGAPTTLRKGNTVSTPLICIAVRLPICIAIRLPFVLQYASHLYRSTFGKISVVVVTGMFPNIESLCHKRVEVKGARQTSNQKVTKWLRKK